jgi:transcriptional regulator with XRE-family HTH domain
MELKNKLKELRISHGMTQETVAEGLGVSSQTVSKWERGLLFPDITLLPKIALLFKCSIDFLFDMDLIWGIEHRREFEAKIRELHSNNDWEGVYQAWVREIELNPDNYKNYPDIMLHVLRKKLYAKDHIEKIISLAEHAEKCCTDDDIRNEIYRIMLQVCSEADDTHFKVKAAYYYKKLPLLRHSREVYAKFVIDGEEYRTQVMKNIIYTVDLAECSVRQLILPDMPPEEKLFYYQKAAALLETVLDGKYAGAYDPPLLSDYCEIAKIHAKLGQADIAEKYVERIIEALEKHTMESEKENTSKLLYSATLNGAVSTAKICKNLLKHMLNTREFEPFKDKISEMIGKFDKEQS